MPNEFKIRNGLVVDAGGATVTGSLTARQTGFNASGIFTGDTIGAIALTTTASAGHSIFSSAGTLQIYDNTGTATRFYINNSGDVGIGTTSPGAKLSVKGTVKIEDQTGTPGGGTQPGTPTQAYGTDPNTYLSEPSVWLKLNIDGTNYYFPGYQ